MGGRERKKERERVGMSVNDITIWDEWRRKMVEVFMGPHISFLKSPIVGIITYFRYRVKYQLLNKNQLKVLKIDVRLNPTESRSLIRPSHHLPWLIWISSFLKSSVTE